MRFKKVDFFLLFNINHSFGIDTFFLPQKDKAAKLFINSIVTALSFLAESCTCKMEWIPFLPQKVKAFFKDISPV